MTTVSTQVTRLSTKVSTQVTRLKTAESSEYTGAPTVYSNSDDLPVLHNENERLRELAGYRKQLLDDSE